MAMKMKQSITTSTVTRNVSDYNLYNMSVRLNLNDLNSAQLKEVEAIVNNAISEISELIKAAIAENFKGSLWAMGGNDDKE